MNRDEKSALSELKAEVSDLRDALLGTKLQPNGLLRKVNALSRRLRRVELFLIATAVLILAGERALGFVMKFLL